MKRFARIRTANFTAKPLRKSILTDSRAVVRLGSITPTTQIFGNIPNIVEVNTVESIQNSRSKLRMKRTFYEQKVPQAEGWTTTKGIDFIPVFGKNKAIQINELPYPIVVKRVFGFQGKGMELIEDEKQFKEFLRKHPNMEGWLIEKFYNYAREYRLHVATGIGVFLSWRKLRTKEADNRWFFNSTNSNWVGEQHNLFDRPKCWKQMEEAAVNCIKATGLDIGAVDIRVQSNNNNDKNQKFIVCEINSAPALGEIGIDKYREIIKQIIINKNK